MNSIFNGVFARYISYLLDQAGWTLSCLPTRLPSCLSTGCVQFFVFFYGLIFSASPYMECYLFYFFLLFLLLFLQYKNSLHVYRSLSTTCKAINTSGIFILYVNLYVTLNENKIENGKLETL